jgi:hypothetical protein
MTNIFTSIRHFIFYFIFKCLIINSLKNCQLSIVNCQLYKKAFREQLPKRQFFIIFYYINEKAYFAKRNLFTPTDILMPAITPTSMASR